MIEWLSDPAVAGIVGAIGGAAISGLVALFVWYKSRKIKRVDCFVGNPSSLLSISEHISEKLEVTYDKRPVESAFLFPVEIVNSGQAAVENQPLIIQLAEGSNIVDFKLDKSPTIGFGAVRTVIGKGNRLELNVELLNPKDSLRVSVLSIDNPSPDIEVGLKNADVQDRVYTRKSVETAFSGLSNEKMFGALAVLSAVPFFGSMARTFATLEVARRLDKLSKKSGI